MTRSEICHALERSYQGFVDYVNDLSPDEFEFVPEGKWSAGQQAVHLVKSTDPLVTALELPKFILKTKFGTANRPSRTYEELIEKYMLKLEMGGKASGKYVPRSFNPNQWEKTSKHLLSNINKLCEKIPKWSKEELDKYILPHPLLGKVTVREMLYFTIHHGHHHQILIKKYLKGV